MELDVAFLPRAGVTDVAVVIDVLRMTTTATTLLQRGMEELVIVADTRAAIALAGETESLLFGERHGLPYPGFHGGNSPVEHAAVDYAGRSAILCTTNGSKAVEAVNSATHVLLGSIVNAKAVARLALELADERITLVCAGTDGDVSLDDVLGAGCIAVEVLANGGELYLTDAAKIALKMALSPDGVFATLAQSEHASTMRELGFAADVDYAARASTLNLVAKRVAREPSRFAPVAVDPL